jgi:hypothetical protein
VSLLINGLFWEVGAYPNLVGIKGIVVVVVVLGGWTLPFASKETSSPLGKNPTFLLFATTKTKNLWFKRNYS